MLVGTKSPTLVFRRIGDLREAPIVWEQPFAPGAGVDGGLGTLIPEALAVDGAGGAIVTGLLSGTGLFGSNSLYAGSYTYFVVRYTSAGVYDWGLAGGPAAMTFSSDNRQILAATGTSVVLAGAFGGTLRFAGESVTSVSSTDTFLASFSP